MTTRCLRTLALTTSTVALGAGLVSLAGPASSAPAPRAQVAATTSPSASAAASPGSSAGAEVSPAASASSSASPRPSASTAAPTPTGAPSECTVETGSSLDPTVIVSGRPGRVTVTAAPGATIRLFAHSAPSTSYSQAREAVVPAEGQVVFSVTPPTNTSLYAQQVGCDPSETLALGVRTAVGIGAVRNAVRDYTFSGGTLPRRTGRLVSLFRVTSTGSHVLTAQARTDGNGRWAIRRTFTGSGRFGFVARTAADASNLAGTSIVRPTVVH